jgi:hypothetical protein
MAQDVNFLRGTAAQYAALASKSDKTFYYTTDTHKLYLGAYELTTEDAVNTAVSLVNNGTKGNEALYAEITKLEGSASTEGSIAYLLAALKTTIEGEVVNSISAGNNGIEIGGTATARTVGAKISNKSGNALSIQTGSGEEGLYVNVPAGTDYSVTVSETTPEGYAKAYTFSQCGSTIATVNIPKDMVVESGTVETKSESGAWGPAGTYLVLTLANATSDKVYINVSDLIEYVTSGSQAGDMVVIDIDNQHKVTASITDGTVTKAKLVSAVQTSLNKADTALQSSDIAEGATNGTIAVKGTDVAVHGLGSAAYTASTAYDAAGAAAAVQGNSGDASTAATVYGAKAYAKSYADGLASNYDAAGAATTAENNAKAYADGLLTWGSIA